MNRVLNGSFSSAAPLDLMPDQSCLQSCTDGRPQDSGVSRIAHQQNTAIKRAMTEGNMKSPLQLCSIPNASKSITPAIARKPREKLPMVWETFQTLILKLRSFWLNQCAMILPQGGQPKPLSQPTTSMSVNMIAVFTAVFAPKGMTPVRIMVSAERTSPTQRNFLASDLSDTLPMMNLEKA